MRFIFISLILTTLLGCSEEPSANDLDKLGQSEINKILFNLREDRISNISISKITGVQDIKVESIEKVQCLRKQVDSKVFLCDLMIKYEIIVDKNSLSNLVGFGGKKVEIKQVKLLKGKSGWELID
jgi:hypothetical protein